MKLFLTLLLTLLLMGVAHAALIFPPAPENGRETVEKYLHSNFMAYTLKSKNVANVGTLIINTPLPAYGVVWTNSPAKTPFLSTEPAVGFVYYILDGTHTVALICLAPYPKSAKTLDCGALSTGPTTNEDNFLGGIQKALHVAEQLPQVKDHDYEVRDLTDWTFTFTAIWLHGKSDDIIIPTPDYLNRWTAYHPYSKDEMLEILKRIMAEEIKASANRPFQPTKKGEYLVN